MMALKVIKYALFLKQLEACGRSVMCHDDATQSERVGFDVDAVRGTSKNSDVSR